VKPDELIQRATEALSAAYAPYSGYRVGAALLCADGTVVTGCNIENASFGLTHCAERTALHAAVSGGRRQFRAIAIAASGEPAPFPCGACRQVLAEFCGPDLPVYIADGDSFTTLTLGGLLPHGFTFGAPHE
jgi:cytidine deaminase